MTRAACSVVVPTRDRPVKLDRALGTIAAALADDDELIVVDSASRDRSVAAVARSHGATVVRCDLPGVNRARNAGWRASRHEAILFADDDVVVDDGWADGLVRALDARPRAGFIAGRIAVPPSQTTAARPVAIKDEPTSGWLTPDSVGVIGHSASLALRRVALIDVHGWDEALGAGGRFKSAPEVDLFDRLFAAGWLGWYESTAWAWHDQWRDRRELVELDWRYGFGAGARVVKLMRTDRSRARVVAAETVWRLGVKDLARSVAHGWKTSSLLRAVYLAGTVAGAAAASRVPVVDGHFAGT